MSKNKNCYAIQHLTPVEFVVWEVCRRLSNGGKNTLRFSGPKIAARLYKISEPTVRRAARSMEKKGWLILLVPKRRNKPTLYRVLDHSAWFAAHGSEECFDADGISRPRSRVTMEGSSATFTDDDASVKSDSSTFTSDDATVKPEVSTVKNEVSTFTHDDESRINLVGVSSSNLVFNIVPNIVDPCAVLCPPTDSDSPDSLSDIPADSTEDIALPSVPLAAERQAEDDECWRPDFGNVPVDWLQHIARMAIVEVPTGADE